MGYKDLLVNLVLVGIFSIAFLAFANGLLSDNNSPNTLDDNNLTNKITSDLKTFKTDVNTSGEAFVTEDIIADDLSQIPQRSIRNIGGALISAPKSFYDNTVGYILVNIFGQGEDANFQLIITIIGGLLAGVILLYWFKWLRTGDPD